MVTEELELNTIDRPKTYYEILGIKPDASLKEIKNAYLKLARQYHPDHNNVVGDWRMIELNLIYDVLSHSEKKKEYDNNFARKTSYDFTKTKHEIDPIEQKQEYRSAKKHSYLKIIETGLTACLIFFLIYLAFYLIIKILQLNMDLPAWVIKLVPK